MSQPIKLPRGKQRKGCKCCKKICNRNGYGSPTQCKCEQTRAPEKLKTLAPEKSTKTYGKNTENHNNDENGTEKKKNASGKTYEP